MPQRHPSLALVNDETFRRLCRARDLLAARYQSQIFLNAAAREACLSPFHFHRLFHSTFGETPHDFLTHRRMEHARRLLASGEMTPGRISSRNRAAIPFQSARRLSKMDGEPGGWNPEL